MISTFKMLLLLNETKMDISKFIIHCNLYIDDITLKDNDSNKIIFILYLLRYYGLKNQNNDSNDLSKCILYHFIIIYR